MQSEWGLVLAGGGARGAYQIGVWRALQEMGLAKKVGVVAGTSIGALNAALFVQGDLSGAEALWRSISPGLVMADDSRWKCSQERMLQLLRAKIDRELVARSTIRTYAACLTGFPFGTPAYFMLNGCTPERLERTLCASAAVPLLFDPVEIDGVTYTDGGIGLFRDNVPVKPVYEAGCKRIIVVHLDPRQVLPADPYPGRQLIQVVPSEGLGFGRKGQLDFDGHNAAWRMELGYWDGLRQITDALLGAPSLSPMPYEQTVA